MWLGRVGINQRLRRKAKDKDHNATFEIKWVGCQEAAAESSSTIGKHRIRSVRVEAITIDLSGNTGAGNDMVDVDMGLD